MSRRPGDGPVESLLTQKVIPSLNNLSLTVRSYDISTKRKSTADFANEEEDGTPEALTEGEVNDLMQDAMKLIGGLTNIMGGRTLQEVESQTRLLLMAQPMLFRRDLTDVASRTTQLEGVINDKVRDSNLEWCPKGSSCVRLLQSLKAMFFSLAHAPLNTSMEAATLKLDEGSRQELKKARQTLITAVNLMGRSRIGVAADATGAAGSSSTEEASPGDSNLDRFENNLSRLLVFGNVQLVPFPDRVNFLDEWNQDMAAPKVNRPAVEAIAQHMQLLFYATEKAFLVNRANTDSFLDLFKAEALERKKLPSGKQLPNRLFRHIVDDMHSSYIDENVSALAKQYWQMLLLMFDTTVDFENGQYRVNEEGERMRTTEPTKEEVKEYEDARTKYQQTNAERRKKEDEYKVKAAYIKLIMRLAMYQKWSWFANSACSIFSLQALAYNRSIAQTRSGAAVEVAQRVFTDKVTQESADRNNGQVVPEIQRELDRLDARSADGAGAASSNAEGARANGEDPGTTPAESELPLAPGEERSGTEETSRTGERAFVEATLSAVADLPEHETGRVLRSTETTADDQRTTTPTSTLGAVASPASEQIDQQAILIAQTNREMKNTVASLQEELDKSMRQVSDIRTQLSDRQKAVDELRVDLVAANSDKQQGELQIAQLQKERNKLFRAAQSQLGKREEELAEKEAVERRLRQAIEERAEKEAEVEKLQADLAEQDGEMEDLLRQAKADADETVAKLQADVESLKASAEKAVNTTSMQTSASSSETSDPARPFAEKTRQSHREFQSAWNQTNTPVGKDKSFASPYTKINLLLETLLKRADGMQNMKQAAADAAESVQNMKNEKILQNLMSMSAVSKLVKRIHKDGSTDVFARIYGIYKDARAAGLVMLMLGRIAKQPTRLPGDVGTLALFGISSYVLVEVVDQILAGGSSGPFNQWLFDNVDMRSFLMLYRGVISWSNGGRLIPRAFPGFTLTLPWTNVTVAGLARGYGQLWYAGSWVGSWVVPPATWLLDWLGLTEAAAAAFIAAGLFLSLPQVVRMSKDIYTCIPTAPVLGRIVVKLSVVVAEGIQIFWQINTNNWLLNQLPSTATVLDYKAVQAILKVLNLTTEAAQMLVDTIKQNPKVTVSLIALAFALRYANTRYKLAERGKAAIDGQLAKRSRYLKSVLRRETGGVLTVEDLTLGEFFVLLKSMTLRRQSAGLSYHDTGFTGASPPPGEAGASSEGGSGGDEAADDALPPGPATSDSGSDTNDLPIEHVDAFAGISGTVVHSDLFGKFVVHDKPHNEPWPSVSACAALMLHTDLHGLDR